MAAVIGRTTVFKAIKLATGQVVCVHPHHLTETTKVVTEKDYDLAKSLGWCDSPQEALDRFEHEEQQIAADAMTRQYEDRTMSDRAQTEAQAVESTTVRHLPEIPEAPRKRGRPKKTVQ